MPGEYKEIKANDNIRVDEGTLYFNNIQRSDEGQYLCEASNGIGSDLRAVISIRVQSPPKFAENSRNQTVRFGEPAVLHCEANGDIPITLLWYMDDVFIDGRRDNRYAIYNEILANGVNSTLTITPTQHMDSAVFTCVARNDFGRDDFTINLQLQDVPEIPFNLRVVDKSSQEVILQWKEIHIGHSAPNRYNIEYKTSDGSWEDDVKRISGFTYRNRAEVRRLNPATIYDFRIVAENNSSDSSDVVSVITNEEPPSGQPQDVEVKPTSPTSLRVTWKAPPLSKWNGDPLGFYVIYKNHSCYYCTEYVETVEYSMEDEDKEYSLEIKNLEPHTRYGISVEAYNAAGRGFSSYQVNQHTVDGTPYIPPNEVECKTLTSQTIHVNWLAPPYESIPIYGYKVIYAPSELWHDAQEKLVSDTDNSTLEIFLHDLKKSTNYTIQVLATSYGGDGVPSSPIHCRTDRDGGLQMNSNQTCVERNEVKIQCFFTPFYSSRCSD